MSDTSPASMIMLVIVGFVVLLFLMSSAEQGGLLSDVASSSPLYENDETVKRNSDGSAYIQTRPSVQEKTNHEIRQELNDAYYELEELREATRIAKIWGVHSQYEDSISLRRGNVYTDDEDDEYLILYANNNNETPIDISGWLFESYVTGKGATVPLGTEIAYSGRVNKKDPILIEPGDEAIITTGASPIGVSFKENMCTGYFNQFQDFSPYLYEQCPRPIDEMERYANIDLDNDDCYSYVERLRSCRIDRTEAEDADPPLSARCENFIINDLSYAGCVANHRFDPTFPTNTWRIFLGRSDEIWREKREIIRLLDRNRHTVAVIEY